MKGDQWSSTGHRNARGSQGRHREPGETSGKGSDRKVTLDPPRPTEKEKEGGSRNGCKRRRDTTRK